MRPYQPGDDVRTIDWLRTAKAGEPFVKIYVEERELTLVFLVDTSLSMDFGSRLWTKREIAAAFCALLSFVAQRAQDRVGLCLFAGKPGLHLPPRKGAGAVARVVREVIAAEPAAVSEPRTRTRELLTPELMARVSQIQIRTHRMVNAVLSGGYRS